MHKTSARYDAEFQRLRDMEFNLRHEPVSRGVAAMGAGFLIYLHTGWFMALFWGGYMAFSLMAHMGFIATRKAPVPRRDIYISALLFANLQGSFCWFPLFLIAKSEGQLALVGSCLIVTQLMFLIRRSDTLRLYTLVQVLVMAISSLVVYTTYVDMTDTALPKIGVALALLAVNVYFFQTIRISRNMWLSREAAANQAHQAQKMAAIGQLAGGVAHDFNNNLTAIIGSLELIQVIDDPAEQKIDVDNALVAARQAATTVRHLMIFARMERPDLSTVQVHDVANELAELTRRLIPTSVSCSQTFVDPVADVRVDRSQLLAGLINLVVNAVDAMPQGGVLTLDCENRTIDSPVPLADGTVLADGRYVAMTLSDTGHGIPPELMTKIIDPFFTTKPVGKGTGLGLSMVAGMMKEFNGGLAIRSSTSGTQATLYLPVVQ